MKQKDVTFLHLNDEEALQYNYAKYMIRNGSITLLIMVSLITVISIIIHDVQLTPVQVWYNYIFYALSSSVSVIAVYTIFAKMKILKQIEKKY